MIIFTHVEEGDTNPEVLDPVWRSWEGDRDEIAVMACQQFIRERGGVLESELMVTVWTYTEVTPCWNTGRPMQVKRTLFQAHREAFAT